MSPLFLASSASIHDRYSAIRVPSAAITERLSRQYWSSMAAVENGNPANVSVSAAASAVSLAPIGRRARTASIVAGSGSRAEHSPEAHP